MLGPIPNDRSWFQSIAPKNCHLGVVDESMSSGGLRITKRKCLC